MKIAVITSYIPDDDIEKHFLDCLHNFVKINKASLYVLQSKENNKKDLDTPFQKELKEGLLPWLKEHEFSLNKNLVVSNFRISQNTIDPIQGMESFAAKHGNIILPFPRHRFKMTPRMLKESQLPRGIWCTGSISKGQESYKNNKSGSRMKDYHKIGALVVVIENNKIFHVRQISYNGKGFYDKNHFYNANSRRLITPAGLVMGDDHATHCDPVAKQETIRQINKLGISTIVGHDTYDHGNNTSHHMIGRNLSRGQNLLTIKDELRLTSNHIQHYKDKCKNLKRHLLVGSNHPEHLPKYLESGLFMQDPTNMEVCLELALAKFRGFDPLKIGLQMYNPLKHVEFLDRESSVTIAGIQVADHGDFGANGSRGNPKGKGVTYSGKVVTGHTHSPEITPFGNFVTGTLTFLNLPYTNPSGASSWYNSNVLIYPDGNMTHLHITNGRSCV